MIGAIPSRTTPSRTALAALGTALRAAHALASDAIRSAA